MKTIFTLASLVIASGSAFADDDVNLNDCPPAVQATIKANLRDGNLDDIELYRSNGKEIYVAEVELPQDRDLKLHVQGDGKLLKIREDSSLAELPAAVKTTVDGLLSAGAKVDDVDKETVGDAITFHVEIDRKNATDLDVVISLDGKIISQKEDMDD